MTDDGVPITRRRLLTGIAGAGAFGATGGAFTAATFGDRELLPIGTTAGEAGIDVACDAPDCGVDDGALRFAIDDVVPGERGSRTFTLSIVDNPVRIWLRTDCPPELDDPHPKHPGKGWGGKPSSESGKPDGESSKHPEDRKSKGSEPEDRSDGEKLGGGPNWGGPPKRPIWPLQPLGSVLEVSLSVVDGCDGDGVQLFPAPGEGSWGTLREFQAAFANGALLDADEPCFDSVADACLELDYRLPGWTWVDPDSEADFEIELYAEQCRHVPASDVRDPFETRDCGSGSDPEPEPDPCDSCTELGKIEVEDDRLEEGRYGFDELEAPFATDGHRYEIDVLDAKQKDGGAETTCVEFRLLRDGEEHHEMRRVDLKGGGRPDRDTADWGYCAPPRLGARPHAIEPPATRTPGLLCTSDRGDERDGGKRGGGPSGRTAISHVVVHVCDPESEGGDDE